ncbi:MAG: Gfo/Idh/MocA family oxidoreductase [Bacteroidia bacterium]|nr:MAG: Gfo/Idh/MocA family oxidoreductase [Bacteroidia bacterium]
MTHLNRRKFIKSTAAISIVTMVSPSIAFGSKANSAIRMGVIGCGGRGTAVISSMSQHTNINITAMADLFRDKLDAAKIRFDAINKEKGFPEIAKSSTYVGSQSYLQLLENKEVDAVLISSPAYTHADFMEAATAAGKHVYCEKPVSPDVAGCRKMEKVGERYDKKLSMTIGFQIRYATPYVRMVERIHNGDIGKILSAQLYYLSSSTGVHDTLGKSYDEMRIRNQYLFHALSGGTLLDQSIHMIDVCNWALGEHPKCAIGTGGVDDSQTLGDTWKHFQVAYEYPSTNVMVQATQYGTEWGGVCARFIGTEGTAEAYYTGGVFISGKNAWDSGILRCADSEPTEEQRRTGAFLSSLYDADQNKGTAFIRSIETGNYLNDTFSGVESTLAAIMGREAAMSGEKIMWDNLRQSSQRLDPKLNLSQFDPE